MSIDLDYLTSPLLSNEENWKDVGSNKHGRFMIVVPSTVIFYVTLFTLSPTYMIIDVKPDENKPLDSAS